MGNLCCCRQVDQSTVAITERFGEFYDVLTPGCHCVPWVFGYRIAGRLSLRIQQLEVECEAKTKDNLFVNVVASVQYRALQKDAHHAFYRLSNTKSLIKAYVLDVVRSTVPEFDLEAAFERKIEIANAVEEELAQALTPYGYVTVQTLIVDIKPDRYVRRAMDETNAAAARLKMKAIKKAEAEMLIPDEITHRRGGEWYGTELGEADSVCAKKNLDHKCLSQTNLKVDNGVLIKVEPSVLSPPPVVGSTNVTVDSVLESKLNEFMLEMRNNNVLLRKLYDVVEDNKFWKDLVLGLHTPASTGSGPFPTTPRHGSMNIPANLQDLCAVAGQKSAKEYGLEDLFAKSTEVLNEGTSKAPGAASKAPDGEDNGDTEDFMVDTT